MKVSLILDSKSLECTLQLKFILSHPTKSTKDSFGEIVQYHAEECIPNISVSEAILQRIQREDRSFLYAVVMQRYAEMMYEDLDQQQRYGEVEVLEQRLKELEDRVVEHGKP